MITLQSGSNSVVIHIEDGERVLPCRCGQNHRGTYALEDWLHHNCFHGPMVDMGDQELMCLSCGETFELLP